MILRTLASLAIVPFLLFLPRSASGGMALDCPESRLAFEGGAILSFVDAAAETSFFGY